MTAAAATWVARVRVRRASAGSAKRLERVLAPEAARDVPRAQSRLDRPDAVTVQLTVLARDTSALRAALNTYLGWVQLAIDAERVAEGNSAPEALI